jgi:hypothetical protein
MPSEMRSKKVLGAFSLRWDMAKSAFVFKIKPFVEKELGNIVRVAGENIPDASCDTKILKEMMAKIRELAELMLISRLVELKDDWLTLIEMQFTLDLFHEHFKGLKSFDRQNPCNRNGMGILNEVREYMASQSLRI